jgi:3-dehydroquinate synthase
MNYLQQSFRVQFEYPVYFTKAMFDLSNPILYQFLNSRAEEGTTQKILFVIDQGVADKHPTLIQNISAYFKQYTIVQLVEEMVMVAGGEEAKNNISYFNRIVEAVNLHGIDRHSYLAAIGGGSVLDTAGYAAAVSHRGIKHIRIPTTVLSQNDSGIGVKNGINFFGKKNFLGTFSPPVAVINDEAFLATLGIRDWRSGMAEAVKVALIKDAAFFEWLERHAGDLVERKQQVMNELIYTCARLHMEHIAGGDPFEKGSSRPLDFGHWSAHKLEQLTGFEVIHGEAVALGIALDSMYSCLSGRLPDADLQRIILLLQKLGFAITHPIMEA